MSRLRALTIGALAAMALGALPAEAQVRAPVAFAWAEAFKGDEENQLRWPVAVAAGPEAELMVADAQGSRLLLFQEIASGWKVGGTLQLPAAPVALTHDGNRYLVALRQRNQVMEVEVPSLRLRPVNLPNDTVPGALAGRRNGGLLVFDHVTESILMLDAEGQLERAVSVEGQVTAVVARPDGGFFAAVAHPASVRSFDATGEVVVAWPVAPTAEAPAWPSGLTALPGGHLLVADRHAGRLLLLDGGGRLAGLGSRKGWEPGLLLFPAGLARLSDGRIAVADQGNGRVQIFRQLDP